MFVFACVCGPTTIICSYSSSCKLNIRVCVKLKQNDEKFIKSKFNVDLILIAQ